MAPKKSTSSHPLETANANDASVSEHTSPDPTARWEERVREMSEAKNIHPSSDENHAPQKYGCPLTVDVHAIADAAQNCIAKRPLTSMVIAATAGATITALLAALISSGRRGR